VLSDFVNGTPSVTGDVALAASVPVTTTSESLPLPAFDSGPGSPTQQRATYGDIPKSLHSFPFRLLGVTTFTIIYFCTYGSYIRIANRSQNITSGMMQLVFSVA